MEKGYNMTDHTLDGQDACRDGGNVAEQIRETLQNGQDTPLWNTQNAGIMLRTKKILEDMPGGRVIIVLAERMYLL